MGVVVVVCLLIWLVRIVLNVWKFVVLVFWVVIGLGLGVVGFRDRKVEILNMK